MTDSSEPLHRAAIAFSTPLRLEILRVLKGRPGATAHDMAEELGVLRQTLGMNLRALETAGLIISSDPSDNRRGRRLRYHVDVDAYLDVLETIRRILCS